MTRYRPTVVEIDLDAVRDNVRRVKPDGVGLMAVVKADGYGHGAAQVARAALEAGASWLGVALAEEGLALRERGIAAPVLVLAELPAGSEKEALAAGLTPTVSTPDGLAGIAEAAAALGLRVGVHLKLDTGMHRVGLWPPEDAVAFAERIRDAGLELEGLWTHFADSESDDAATLEQLRRFRASAASLAERGIRPRLLHAANSGALLRLPETHLDLVRPGAAVYGLDVPEGVGLRPALSWRSAVTMVKRLPAGERISYGGRYVLEGEATVATVPVGYADGFPRAASGGAGGSRSEREGASGSPPEGGKAGVLIRARRHRVAGTVTMDQIMVDCADHEVAPGDEVVLVGEQGAERIAIEELAAHAGTIGREIATGIGSRVPRSYRGGGPGGSRSERERASASPPVGKATTG